MPRNTSVTLGEHFDRFVAEKIKEGRRTVNGVRPKIGINGIIR